MDNAVVFNPKNEIYNYLINRNKDVSFWQNLANKEIIVSQINELPHLKTDVLYLSFKGYEDYFKVILELLCKASVLIISNLDEKQEYRLLRAFFISIQNYDENDYISCNPCFGEIAIDSTSFLVAKNVNKNMINGIKSLVKLPDDEAISIIANVFVNNPIDVQFRFIIALVRVSNMYLKNYMIKKTTGSEDNLLYYLKLFSNIGFCSIKPLIK